MALTRDFKKTVERRAWTPLFAESFSAEGIESMLAGDVDTGKAVLRNYINATVGFSELAQAVHRSPKSLMRMLGPNGNPQAQNLFQIVAYLMSQEGARFKLRTAKA